MARVQYNFINTKQNSFHINSVFLFSKTYFMIQKIIIYTGFYFVDASIEGNTWSVRKRGRGADLINSSLRCTPTLIQSPS